MVKIEEASSSSLSSFTHPWKYHVYLSFRGEDTRNNFTGHLCSALRHKGITTFMDDELRRGEEISTALVQAIEQSKISIIVFSKNYASSKWCLDELVKILECKKSNIQQMVRPVFYKVDPSDIRNLRKCFGEALANHERKFKVNLDKVQKWKQALSEAANLSGWPLLDEHHSESKLIGDIVEEISKQVIERTYLEVAKYPVGIEPRVQYVNALLSVEGREEVRVVGIWGTGGIGKTTIAKAVYNSISRNFDGSCFLENVRENSMRSSRGLVKLQQTLLLDILGGTKLKVTNGSKGITMIKESLRCKRVLLVLDDVNHLNQLNSLAGESDWFGTGSRIIITTRDKKLLTAHNVNLIYKVNELDYHEALELFCWNAFKRNEPLDYFVELTERAIGYAQGLPLALRVLGSYLYGGNLDTWKATLDVFKSPEIQEILKISYDALVDTAKEVFLDIACFFNGRDKKYVIEMLEGCGLNPNNGVIVLIEMALVNIDKDGCICMHDLVEEMGKEIVHQESPNDPGKRSRLWFHDDVYHVLTENIGTTKITGIKVELPEDSDVICLSGTTFSKMRNLRLFIHCAGCFSGVLDYLPNSLRVVDWPDCPFQSLPSNFNPRKLALLHMPKSRITGFGEGFKHLINLTSINFNGCMYLTKVSDLSGIPNLKSLNLAYCRSLVEVHSSVGFLDKLDEFNLHECTSLEIFPRSVSWTSLRKLNLHRCTRLESFIKIVDKMDSIWRLDLAGSGIKELPSWIRYLTSLRELNMRDTRITELPSSIGYLTSLRKLNVSETCITELPSSIGYLCGLESLDLNGCEKLTSLPHSMYELQHLRYLDLSKCPKLVIFPNKEHFEVPLIEESLPLVPPTSLNISHDNCGSLLLFPRLEKLHFKACNLVSVFDFLASLDCLFTLNYLNLSGSNLVSLPLCISKFVGLRYLDLNGCKSLKEILELPSNIEEIDVGGCVSLETFPTLSRILELNDTQLLKSMNLSNCHRLLVDKMGFDVVSKMAEAVELNEVVSKMANALVLNQVDKKSDFEVKLPGSEVPKWLGCHNDDICELLIEVPRTLKWEKTGLVVCAVIEATQDHSVDCYFGLDITVNGVDHITVDEVDMDDYTPLVFYFEETVKAHVWLKYIPLNVDIKQEVDTQSDQSTPYSCRLSFSYLDGEGYLFKSCGVHLANVPYDDDDDDDDDDNHHGYDDDDDDHDDEDDDDHHGYDDDDDEEEEENDEDDVSGEDFEEAETATVSAASVSVLSGGISTKRGLEHCDHDGEPHPTKRFK